MILISNDFWDKIKIYNFDPNNVMLAITELLMTASVLQGHIYRYRYLFYCADHCFIYFFLFNALKNIKVVRI